MFSFLATAFSGKIAKTLVALWVKDESIISIATDLGAGYFDLKLHDYHEARKAERFFSELEDEIFESIDSYISIEFRNEKSGDLKIAIKECLKYSCSVKFYQKCIGHGLRIEPILEDFTSENSDRPNQLFISEHLYFSLGRHVISSVVSSLEAFPKFTLDALKNILSDTTEMLERINKIDFQLDRIEEATVRKSSSSESAYRNAIVGKLSKINIFGVETAGLPKRYDLSLAYVNLTISGRMNTDRDSASKIIALALKNEKPLTIVSGDPGSGKTTLLSWLTLSTIQKKMPDHLHVVNDYLPIFLRLRDFAGTDFPVGPDLILHTAGVGASKIDDKWANFVLQNRKLIFLLDGFDELPAKCRARAENWIDEILINWPNCKVIVSSRSYAVAELEQLISQHGHPGRELNVEPMNLDQISLLISRWYKAYEHQISMDKASDIEELQLLKSRLIKQILSKSVLRSIVRNPLICSLMCFVNTDRKGIVPNDRGELYRIATSALVTRRDAERGIDEPLSFTLSDRQRVKILSFVAEYFYQRKSFQLKLRQVTKSLEEYLPSLGVEGKNAKPIISFLTKRSHVLRSPTVGMVDFSHKTFQEYFFALRLLDKGMVEWVRDNFVDPDFDVICAFVMSISPPSFANDLVSQLLSKLSSYSEHDRRRCLLILQGSIRDVAELDPTLRSSVQGYLEEVLPPKTMHEAEELAATGSIIIEPLAEFASSEHNGVWTYCVAALIGSMEEEAVYALQKFAELGDPTIDNQLSASRSLFKHETFNQVVLSRCRNLTDFEVKSAADLSVALKLPKLSRLILTSLSDVAELDKIPVLSTVKHLVIRNDIDIKSLEFLKSFPTLKTLELYGCSSIKGFDLVSVCKNLKSLKIHSEKLENLAFIQRLPKIEKVDFSESLNFSDLVPLQKAFALREIVLPYSWMYDQLSLTDFSNSIDSAIGRRGELLEIDDEFAEFIGDIDEFDADQLISKKFIGELALEEQQYWGYEDLD